MQTKLSDSKSEMLNKGLQNRLGKRGRLATKHMNKTHCRLASCGLAVVPASQQLSAADTALCRSATGRAIQVRGRDVLAIQQPSLAGSVRILLFSVKFNDDCLIDMIFLSVYSN